MEKKGTEKRDLGTERKHHRGRQQKMTKGQIVSNVVLALAIAVFLFSGFKLWEIFSEYHRGTSEYDSLREVAIQSEPSNTPEEEEIAFSVDFATLREMNPEVVGWIRFDEPSQISYPLVRGADNEKYLHTTFEGKENAAGALFVDADNAADFTDRNTFIYGHNMKNGSMFGQLRKYKDSAFAVNIRISIFIHRMDGK